jgi:aminoglycoside phosphotransferase (APT) family kinase protein
MADSPAPSPVRTTEPPREVEVSVELARALLADQHPDLADLPIVHVEDGWDNVMFRLGDTLALRLPRRLAGGALIVVEQTWLPLIAPHLPLPTPTPLRAGAPGCGYPFRWSVVPWLEGAPSDLAPPDADQGETLAAFLAALHQPAPAKAPRNAYRGSIALADRAETFELRHAEGEALHGALDPALRRAWAAGVAAPIDAPRTWFHGDLHGRNVLVKGGRLAGVIDWGDMAAGDAACDLAAIWMLLPDREARRRAMAAYPASDATWVRARGWAALMTVMLLSITNNPRMPAMGQRMMNWLAAGP